MSRDTGMENLRRKILSETGFYQNPQNSYRRNCPLLKPNLKKYLKNCPLLKNQIEKKHFLCPLLLTGTKAKSLSTVLKKNEKLFGIRFSMSNYKKQTNMVNVPLPLAEEYFRSLICTDM